MYKTLKGYHKNTSANRVSLFSKKRCRGRDMPWLSTRSIMVPSMPVIRLEMQIKGSPGQD
ncbi:MAG: hypothetical protein HYR55_13430 [Acidobacteria bacterium]|nr:hypothetical protein [Acidobacteriota bacterium]MBI3655704.1 hypothetical protein [Acidobacteriota bacterium]